MAHRKESESSARRIKALEAEEDVLRLRETGLTYKEIAKQRQSSVPTVHKQAHRALARLRDRVTETCANLVVLELQRLDRLQTYQWRAAASGDVPATNTILRIMERRARLLGLDAPTKTDITASVEGRGQVVVYLPDNGRGDSAPATIVDATMDQDQKPG